VSALDRFLGACSAADPSDLSRLLAVSSEIPLAAEYEQLLPEFATTSPPAVRALLSAGVPVDSRGHYGGTALHWACWKGYADLVDGALRGLLGASLHVAVESLTCSSGSGPVADLAN
jgi:hypothetical protein